MAMGQPVPNVSHREGAPNTFLPRCGSRRNDRVTQSPCEVSEVRLRQDAAGLEMTKPVRLQLSRRKGFDLQTLSQATNGLEAVNVARPSRFGNPFTIENTGRVDAVLRFACEIAPLLPVDELRGKNLACWCKPGEKCHADVLLEMANK